jgi:importin-4
VNGAGDFASGTGESPADAISIIEAQSIEDIDVEKLLDVNSSIAVEKEIAADTFGSLFGHTKEFFLPYLEPSTVELCTMLEHYYEGIRKAATESLLVYISTFYELSEPQEWVAGAKVVRCSALSSRCNF